MKKLTLFLVLIFSNGFAYGQLTLEVDSIDISKNIDIEYNHGGIVMICDDGRPILHIAATVTNSTDDDILLYDNIFPSKIWLDYQVNNCRYHEKLLWIRTIRPTSHKRYYDIYLHPDESKKILFVTYISDSILFRDPQAISWKWDRDPIADSEYIDWLKGILPTMKIIIDYGQRSKEIKRLVSEPINLETLKITTNLKDERVN